MTGERNLFSFLPNEIRATFAAAESADGYMDDAAVTLILAYQERVLSQEKQNNKISYLRMALKKYQEYALKKDRQPIYSKIFDHLIVTVDVPDEILWNILKDHLDKSDQGIADGEAKDIAEAQKRMNNGLCRVPQ